MKRSQINSLIDDAKSFFRQMHFALPPWAFWGPEQWKGHGESEVVDHQLGWDLTDYGGGDFWKKGLILFTIRNGSLERAPAKPYAEKIMIVNEGQVCPMHYHWTKVEDIINRGGGNLTITLHGSEEDGSFSTAPLRVSVDGFEREVAPGGEVILTPGESITLVRGMYHAFTAQPDSGRVLVGEVSSVNDDHDDNRFFDPQARFPEIDEDTAPNHLLVGDYKNWI
ncbi:MAG: D-lyxose/D-mannose family sugar isomerase [Proteobacteria bacterium]|nr:D-lyxose/D-mannose family sugar isomerase [Pseudomonadota bacterium]MBU1611049.1 D-lyxose/D-mannose family sugar isomerase [Pseudomonadota bacterium]